jgi:hypothetical protein
MKNFLAFSLFTFLFIANCYSDNAGGRAQEAKKRILLVALEEPKVDTAGDAKTEFNIKIKNVFSQFWTFNDSIIYKPRSEVMKINASGNTQYLIADFRYTGYHYSHLFTPFEEITNKHDFESARYIYFCLSEDILPSSANKTRRVVVSTAQCDYNDEADMTTGIKKVQTSINWAIKNGREMTLYDVVNMNHSLLYAKILLVDTALLYNKADTAKIPEYYPYPFKISNQKEIYNLRSNHDEKYAYIEIEYSTFTQKDVGHCLALYYIYDTKDHKTLSFSSQYDKDNKIHLKNFRAYSLQ